MPGSDSSRTSGDTGGGASYTIRENNNENASSSGGDSSIFEDTDIELISDEDLADVQDNVSLESNENFSFEDSSEDSLRGYIDDEITNDVTRAAEERLNINKRSFSMKVITLVFISFVAIFATILSLNENRERSFNKAIEERINDKSTAFEFDDRDDFTKKTGKIDNILNKEFFVETGTVFPTVLEQNLIDFHGPPFDEKYEIPFFWQVPNSGSIFQSIMTACLNKVLASGVMLEKDNTMKIHEFRNFSYVNVDLFTEEGIKNAADQGLIESGLADVIVTTHINFATSELFDAKHKGRLFSLFRHPVDRAISSYHSLISSTNDPKIAKMTLEQFVSSHHMDKDWVIRFLLNKQKVQLVDDDVHLAKEIIRRKCLVGLHEQIENSLHMLEQYFSWTTHSKAHDICKREIIRKEHIRAKKILNRVGGILNKEDQLYKKIVSLNLYDMELYWYAHDIFNEQKKFLINK